MSLFADLITKIFGQHLSVAPSAQAPTPRGSPVPAPVAPATTPATPVATPVDVGAVLDGLAAKNSESLDWKHSIVDLLKLVGMDSSLSARKQLAAELQYSGDMNDSATLNVWLHQEVLQKLSENGGKVPSELLKSK